MQLVKQCNAMLEAGRTYCQSSKSFVSGLRELGYYLSEDTTMGVSDLVRISLEIQVRVFMQRKRAMAEKLALPLC